MRARDYYQRWAKTAFTSSLSRADLSAGLASAFLGAIDYKLPELQLMTAWGWQVPLWSLVGVVAVRLITAPYLMAREDASRPHPLIRERADISITDAFYYIAKAANSQEEFEHPYQYMWIGDELREKLANGEIQAWGCRMRRNRLPTPRITISKEYWEEAEFTYSFLGATSEEAHVRPDTSKRGLPSYTELFFNLEQLRREWPP